MNSNLLSRTDLLGLMFALDEKEARLCEKRFAYFFRCCWDELNPDDRIEWNWHYDLICDTLQAESERIAERADSKYDVILINVPPRSAKTWLVTISWNAWTWIKYSWIKFFTTSYSDKLALDHSMTTRDIIKSPWYRRNWGDRCHITVGKDEKGYFRNNVGGYRVTSSVRGTATGRGGDIIIADDPQSANEAKSDASRAYVVDWWDRVMYSRLNNYRYGCRVVIQQRLHQNDLSGHILETYDRKKILHLNLPAEDSDDVSPVSIRKKYRNGLLMPSRFNRKFLDDAKHRMGSFEFAGQYNQRVSPEEGGMFKRKWWGFWKPVATHYTAPTIGSNGDMYHHSLINLPDSYDDVIMSIDCTFKGTEGTDRVSMQVWAMCGANKFLLANNTGHYNILQTIERLTDLRAMYPYIGAILIEDTANGPAVMQILANKVSGMIPVKPLGSKVARVTDASKAMSVVAQCEAGNIFLPHPQLASWVWDYIEEFADFPRGKHDDQVDATSQALNRLSNCVDIMFT